MLDGFGLTTPAAAPVVAQSAAVDAYALTTGRVVDTVAALVALAGVVIGGLWCPPPRVVPAPATGLSAALRVSPET
jgi:hypothetical protein